MAWQGPHLPDEIISEILLPALRVPDETFSATNFANFSNGASPFVSFSESPSAYLVVCKSWLRVATPLLYNVVVIRSKAQAQALAGTLAANPALGRFIRKLRVEGGYAISMHKVLQNSPNITDIFLTVEIPRSDNVCGLVRGLPLIDPVRVIIDSGSLYSGLSHEAYKLLDVLKEKCLPCWKKMTVFEVQDSLMQKIGHSTGAGTISRALSCAPSLATLSLLGFRGCYRDEIPAYLQAIATNTALKCIRVEPLAHDEDSLYYRERRIRFRETANKNEKLRGLFKFPDLEGGTTKDADLPPAPFIYPPQFAADPVQEDAIWSRILYFALYDNWSKQDEEDSDYDEPPSYAGPLRVCKRFARLGTPYLYANPVLDWTAQEAFSAQLTSQPSLGRHIRTLVLHEHSSPACVRTVILSAPLLVEVRGKSCSPIVWKTFRELGEKAGSTLRSFRGIPISKASALDSKVFSLYPELREFGWDSQATVKTTPKSIPRDAFGLLVDLTVGVFDASFLKVLAQMELPSLRTATFAATAYGGAPFFQRHGAKLQEVTLSSAQIADPDLAIWRNCPALTVLGVSCDPKHPAKVDGFEKVGAPHACLQRIVFQLAPPGYRLRAGHETDLHHLLRSLRFSKSFPALREVEHPYCHWPTTERDILKNSWVTSAETLSEAGVHLVGPTGVHWRPRLKFVSKGKSKSKK
ncbi:hypothetical protein C8R46DRAFT_987469 [Mycena filopes]|nr:hypothetical protein C8R46DRAFT_987469 [Mycena filopes]